MTKERLHSFVAMVQSMVLVVGSLRYIGTYLSKCSPATPNS